MDSGVSEPCSCIPILTEIIGVFDIAHLVCSYFVKKTDFDILEEGFYSNNKLAITLTNLDELFGSQRMEACVRPCTQRDDGESYSYGSYRIDFTRACICYTSMWHARVFNKAGRYIHWNKSVKKINHECYGCRNLDDFELHANEVIHRMIITELRMRARHKS